MQGKGEIPQERIDAIYRGYNVLESYLKQTKWMASNENMTLADLAIFSWMESVTQVFLIEKYPKIQAWMSEMRKLPYYGELNKKGADIHIKIFKDALENNKKN
jgi:glutathione S-transferase